VVLVDRDMSPAAGASASVAVGRMLARIENAVVPLRLFEERGRLRRTANRVFRAAKLTLFDAPQEDWLRVTTHEVFGHGGRLRELFNGPIGYSLPAPPPYGRGGGATFFQFDRPPTVEEVLAVTVGGMEANRIVARRLTEDAITQGRWQYRDALRYFNAELDTISYVLRTDDHEKEGHDVGDFIMIYNDVAAVEGEKLLNAQTLRREALVGFANPMIAYAFYSTFISYVTDGRETSPVPMLHIGETRYLPMARFELTSFGTEWVIDNAIVRGGRFMDASLRIGRTIGARTWGGGLRATRLAAWNGWTFDGEAHLWHQPEWGGAATVTADHHVAELRRLRQSLGVVIQAGYKTGGFLAGERVHRGGALRVGVTLTKQ
jgi:hypothetical protein